MRALIIGKEEKEAIENLKTFASNNIYTQYELEMIENNLKDAPGDLKEFVITIPNGFRIVFTYEMQSIGLCKHISISLTEGEKYPSVEHTQMILEEFGFIGNVIDGFDYGIIFLEEEASAINILQKDDLIQ